MKLRLFSGLIAAAILVCVIYFANLWLVTSVVVVLALLSYKEFDRLLFEEGDQIRVLRMSCLITVTLLCLKQNLENSLPVVWFVFISMAVHGLIQGNRTGQFKKCLTTVSVEWLGFVYVVSLVGFVMPIIQLDSHGRHWVMLLFLIVFVGDSFAYFAGKLFGRHPLVARLSPKKTWEGAVVGFIATIGAAYIWATFIHPIQIDLRFLGIVALTGILAQLGDLFESLLKRSQREKDSGAFLPGHGGLLDRIDGLAFSSPFYFCALKFVLGLGRTI